MNNAFDGLISRLDTVGKDSLSLSILQWKLLQLKNKEKVVEQNRTEYQETVE